MRSGDGNRGRPTVAMLKPFLVERKLARGMQIACLSLGETAFSCGVERVGLLARTCPAVEFSSVGLPAESTAKLPRCRPSWALEALEAGASALQEVGLGALQLVLELALGACRRAACRHFWQSYSCVERYNHYDLVKLLATSTTQKSLIFQRRGSYWPGGVDGHAPVRELGESPGDEP